MAKFSISLQKNLAHEGVYSNDPDDLGKETYKGISRIFHPKWNGWVIIDGLNKSSDFPHIFDNNVELQKQVELFYLHEFWLPLQADQIQNQTTADSIFDFAVNSGIKKSVQLTQFIVGVKADGIIGVQSLKKLNSMDFGYFQPAFTVAKIFHYVDLIQKRPVNKKYLLGWITRALEYANV